MASNGLIEWGKAHWEGLAVIHEGCKIGNATDEVQSLEDKNSFLKKDRNFIHQ